MAKASPKPFELMRSLAESTEAFRQLSEQIKQGYGGPRKRADRGDSTSSDDAEAQLVRAARFSLARLSERVIVMIAKAQSMLEAWQPSGSQLVRVSRPLRRAKERLSMICMDAEVCHWVLPLDVANDLAGLAEFETPGAWTRRKLPAEGESAVVGNGLEVLYTLAARDAWPVDELPDDATVDLLRCLDADGLIQACGVVMQNRQEFPGDTTPPAPVPGEWFSPIEQPKMVGDWDTIFRTAARRKPKYHPCLVRVTDRGRAELAKGCIPLDQPVSAPKERVLYKDVQRRMIELADRGEEFSSRRKLAEQFGCSRSVIDKAIKDDASGKLKRWAQSKAPPKTIKAQALPADLEESSGGYEQEFDAACDLSEKAFHEGEQWLEEILSPEDLQEYRSYPVEQQKVFAAHALDQKREEKGRPREHKNVVVARPAGGT
ncbi:MAG: hypothetical protein AAGB34_08745 [Planctomycetota bacterium]